MKRILYFLLLLTAIAPVAAGQTASCQYWIDTSLNMRQAPLSNGTLSTDIDMTGIEPGMHVLTFRAGDGSGNWSAPVSRLVFISPYATAGNITRVEYWIDNIASRQTEDVTGGVFAPTLDLSALSDGMHLLTFRAADNNGRWSAPSTMIVMKRPDTGTNVVTAYQYWYNDFSDKITTVSLDNPSTPCQLTAALPFDKKTQTARDAAFLGKTDDNRPAIFYVNCLNTRFRDSYGNWSGVHCDTFGIEIDKGAAVDLTSAIVNPDASQGKTGWKIEGSYGKLIQQKTHYRGKNIPYFRIGYDKYTSWTTSLTQVVEGLPAGSYIVSVASRAAKGVDFHLYANDEQIELPAIGDTGGEIWEDALPDSPEKLANDGKGSGWSRRSLLVSTDGGPLTIKVEASTSSYGKWADVVDFRLQTNAEASLDVVYDDSIDPADYKDMTLVLKSASGRIPVTTTASRSYSFNGLKADETCSVSLENHYGQILWERNSFTPLSVGYNLVIDNIRQLHDVTMGVELPDGTDVTRSVKVRWFDTDGNYLDEGATIKGIVDGSAIDCDLTLGDSLGVVYTTPARQRITATSATRDNKTTLERLTLATLAGSVYSDSRKVSGASLSVSQTIAGRYNLTSRTTTDGKGAFTIDVPADSCHVTIASNGYYNTTVDAIAPADLGRIELQPITGDIVALSVMQISRKAPDAKPDTTLWAGNIDNIAFSLSNLSTGADNVPVIQQNGYLVVESGLSTGDRLRITARSVVNEFSETACETTVGDNGGASAQLVVTERGGLSLSVTASANQETRALLFDSYGRYIANSILTFDGSAVFAPLESGDYSLVVMGSSDMLGNVPSLEVLTDAGLVEGRDYLYADVNVSDGVLVPVSLGIVPELNETPFYYTSDATSFTSNKSLTTTGKYVTFTTKIDFKEEYAPDVTGISLVIDIPEDCAYVPGSAIIGTKAATTTEQQGTLTISLPDDSYHERVRFCMMPLQGGTFHTHASLRFHCDGDKTQPFGRIETVVEEMGINAPTITNSPEISVSGMCTPNARVSIFDGNVEIGSLQAREDGSWITRCMLNDAYNLSDHNVYAKVETGYGLILTTATKRVNYNISSNCVQSVTMINTAHGPKGLAVKEYVTKFDFINPTVGEKIYWFWPAYPKFTFVVDFMENNPERVDNVVVKVHTSSGDTKELKANYSSSKNRWVATGKFNSYSMPRNVSVAYDTRNDSLLIDQKYIDLQSDYYSDIVETYENALKAQSKFDELNEDSIDNFSADELFQFLIDCEYPIDEEVSGIELPNEIEISLNKMDEAENDIDFENELENFELLLKKYLPLLNCDETDITELYHFITEGGTLQLDGQSMTLTKKLMSSTDLTSDGFTKIRSTNGGISYYKLVDGNSKIYDAENNILSEINWQPTGLDLESDSFEELDNKFNYYSKNLMDEYIALKDDTSTESIQSSIDSLTYEIELYAAICQAVYNKYFNASSNKIVLKGKPNAPGKFGKLAKKGKRIFKVMKKGGLKIWSKVVSPVLNVYNFSKSSINMLSCIPFNTAKDAIQDYSKFIYDNWDCMSLGQKPLAIGAAIGAAASEGGAYFVAAKAYLKMMPYFIKIAKTKSSNKFLQRIVVGKVHSEYVEFTKSSIKSIHKNNLQSFKDFFDECPPEEPEPQQEEKSTDTDSGDVQDPSGYVYEAVTSNRLPDVTATIYQLVTESDMYGDTVEKAVSWDAERYSQQNPLKTDDMGVYAWDVPEGQWQVRFSKPGYDPAATEWLPVPPPQLDVNIGMRHAVSPEVKNVVGYESGVTVTFDKYMKPGSFVNGQISVTRSGETVKGHFSAVNLEENPVNKTMLASRYKFIPDKEFTVGETVTVNVAAGCMSYADMPLVADFSADVIILPEIKSIETDSVVNVNIGATRTIGIFVNPARASAGHTMTVVNASPSIASIGSETVTIDNEGKASLTVTGLIPGEAQLIITVDGTEVTAEVTVNVEWTVEQVARPVASIASGSYLEPGTPVALMSKTPGALIYYTTDGSEPTDSWSRMLYVSPIIVDRTMTVKAVAEKEDVKSSDTVTFDYSTEPLGVDDAVGACQGVTVENGDIVITGCEGARCDVYNVNGIKVWQSLYLPETERISLSGNQIYVVRIVSTDNRVTVNTLMVATGSR